MKSWFSTEEKIDALESSARAWVGTPFVANSRIKGPSGGTCCHMLAEQIYLDAGLELPFVAPSGSMKWSDVSRTSLVAKFLDEQKETFQALEIDVEETQVGDIVGFKIGGCVHHVGIVLKDMKFIHCMRGLGTAIFSLHSPTYKQRIKRIWRPLP